LVFWGRYVGTWPGVLIGVRATLQPLKGRGFWAKVGLLAQAPTHTIGQERPLTVTSRFLLPGEIEWLVFGDQVDRENFRTRPRTARVRSAFSGTA